MIEECNFLNTNEYLSNNNKLSAESLQIPYKSLKILNSIERRSREKKSTKTADQITDQNNIKPKNREYRLAGSKSTNLRDYNLFETLNNHNDFSTLLKTISKCSSNLVDNIHKNGTIRNIKCCRPQNDLTFKRDSEISCSNSSAI